MSCCGNKKDVARTTTNGTHNTIRATKFYRNDNNPELGVSSTGFRPIPQSGAGTYSKITKQENYALQNTSGSKSRIFGGDDSLNFQLDQDPGVSNTFDVPTFDYHTMLSHNIYFNLNAKDKINFEDGNRSRLQTSQQQTRPLV